MAKKPAQYYDVILMEQFNSDCMFGLAHILKAPVIALSSCAQMPWHYERMGNPQTPSLTPALFMGYSDQMSFRERLSNWIAHYGMKALYYTFADTDANAIVKKYLGEGIPDVRQLAKETSMYFVNQHFSLSGAKPLPPSVVELGGIHIKEQQPLEEVCVIRLPQLKRSRVTFKIPLLYLQELETFISSATHGVIYISWGSMARFDSMPPEKLSAILNALGRFKQKFVLKWNGDLPNKPSNVYVGKWLPQRDILCHPNVKVFWTHGGLGGSSEAATCAVPVVSTPLYGDQFLNSAAFVSRGAGIVLPYEEITVEKVVEALSFALKPSTAENARRISNSYKQRPMSQVDTAVYWVEHTIKTGGDPLMKSSAPFLPWYVYYGLDVYAVIIASLLVLILSWVALLRLIWGGSKSGGQKQKRS